MSDYNSFEMGGGASSSKNNAGSTISGSSIANSPGDFVKHVFLFDDATKSDLLNIAQYATIAAVPISFFIKMMNKYVPPANANKGTFELVVEILAQLIALFFGLFFINRIVTFFPTYSGESYAKVDITYIILSVMIITMSLQTKLGEKINILSKRVIELWSGVPQPGAYGPITPKGQDGMQSGSGGQGQGQKYDQYGYPIISRPMDGAAYPIQAGSAGTQQSPIAAPTPLPTGIAEPNSPNNIVHSNPNIVQQPLNPQPAPVPYKRYKAMKG